MVEYSIDIRLEKRLENLVTKEEFDKQIGYKLDAESFLDYKRRVLAAEMADRKEFELNDRFHNIKSEIKTLVSPEMFDLAME